MVAVLFLSLSPDLCSGNRLIKYSIQFPWSNHLSKVFVTFQLPGFNNDFRGHCSGSALWQCVSAYKKHSFHFLESRFIKLIIIH